MKHQLRDIGFAQPIAAEFIRRALRSGNGDSMLHVFKDDVSIKLERNRREMFSLCRIVDSLRHGKHGVALEYAVRRLAGVHTADASGIWATCDAIEMVMDKQSFMPPTFLHDTIRDVNRQMQLMRVGSAAPGPDGMIHLTVGGGGGRGRGGSTRGGSSTQRGGRGGGRGGRDHSVGADSHRRGGDDAGSARP